MGQGSATWPVKIFMIVLCVLWMIPVVGLLDQLLPAPGRAVVAPAGGPRSSAPSPLVDDPELREVLTTDNAGVNMAQAFINSFIVTVPATIIPILIAAFAAYAFTFMQWRGRDIVFIIIVGLLVVPNQVALVPLLKLYGAIGLNGTFLRYGWPTSGSACRWRSTSCAATCPTLPNAIIESAKIDGASHFTTFWRLIMPMSVPALASFAIFQFLWVWNDLLVALLFLGRGENTILTVALQGLQGQTGAGRELIPSAGFVTIIVPLIVFLSLQRFFIRGMTAGAVKG